MDSFQLPVTENVGTCQLELKLRPYSLPEASSWMAVKKAARSLANECRGKRAFGDVTGGAFTAGLHGWIQIQMVRSRDDAEVA